MHTARNWVLPRDPVTPATARRHVRTTCDGLPRDLLEVAVLLTSELVTNAVRYGGPLIVLTVHDDSDALRIEVHDDGPWVEPAGAAEEHPTGGRGLLLVESLAHTWGTATRGSDRGGKAVWFALSKRA
jgi:anti-sigma regulatory factor (Ser/Thr protein kinase)